MDGQLCGIYEQMRHTHSAEDPRNLKDKVELGAAGDLACALRGLKGLGLQLREE